MLRPAESKPEFTPRLVITECAGRVRLRLGTIAQGDGASLQEAGEDLVSKVLVLVMAFRSSGFRTPCELGPPDIEALNFVHELGEIAARGGDIRPPSVRLTPARTRLERL